MSTLPVGMLERGGYGWYCIVCGREYAEARDAVDRNYRAYTHTLTRHHQQRVAKSNGKAVEV